jgi:hypothetical protein
VTRESTAAVGTSSWPASLELKQGGPGAHRASDMSWLLQPEPGSSIHLIFFMYKNMLESNNNET